MLLRALTGVHELPAFVHRHRGRHLDKGMLALLHGFQRHRHMPGPGRGDINHIKVFARDHLLPDVFRAAVNGRAGASFFLANVRRAPGPVIAQITNGHHLGKFNAEAGSDMGQTAVQADDRHPDFRLRRGGEIMHGLLPRRTRPGAADLRVEDDAGGQSHRAPALNLGGGGATGQRRAQPGQRGSLEKVTTGRFGRIHIYHVIINCLKKSSSSHRPLIIKKSLSRKAACHFHFRRRIPAPAGAE